MRGSADGDQRNLLQVRVVIILISLTFCGSNLLNRGACRHDWAEILTVNFVKVWRIGEIVQIHIGSYDLAEIHPGFLEVVEQIAHGLAGLMLAGGAIDSAVWPRYEAAFGRAI